jgi:hypothetical protein
VTAVETRGLGRTRRHDRHAGQAITEMLIVILAICSALLIPWFDGESPAEMLLSAFVGALQGFLHWLAVV